MVNVYKVIDTFMEKYSSSTGKDDVASTILLRVLDDGNKKFWKGPLRYTVRGLAGDLEVSTRTVLRSIDRLVQWGILTHTANREGSFLWFRDDFMLRNTQEASIDANIDTVFVDGRNTVRNTQTSSTDAERDALFSSPRNTGNDPCCPTGNIEGGSCCPTGNMDSNWCVPTGNINQSSNAPQSGMNSSVSNESKIVPNTLSTLSTNTYNTHNTKDKDKRYDNPIKQGLSVTNVTENPPSQTLQSEEKPINPEVLPPWYGNLCENEQKVVDAWQYIVGPFKEEWLPSLRKVLQACYPAQIINSISTFARTKVEAMQGMGFEYVVDPLLKGMFGKRPANKEKKPKDEYKEKMKNFGNIIQRMKEKQERGEL